MPGIEIAFAPGEIKLGEQFLAAAVGTKGFIGEVIQYHQILLVNNHHGGRNVVQHRFAHGGVIAQSLFEGIAGADITLHGEIVFQFAVFVDDRGYINLCEIEAAIATAIDELATPGHVL